MADLTTAEKLSWQCPWWVVFHPCGDNIRCDTEPAAIEAATALIKTFLDDENAWMDEVEGICIWRDGVVTHRANRVDMEPPDWEQEQMEYDPGYKPPFDEYCDYVMERVS